MLKSLTIRIVWLGGGQREELRMESWLPVSRCVRCTVTAHTVGTVTTSGNYLLLLLHASDIEKVLVLRAYIRGPRSGSVDLPYCIRSSRSDDSRSLGSIHDSDNESDNASPRLDSLDSVSDEDR